MVFPVVEAEAGGPPVTIRASFGKTIEGTVVGPAGEPLSAVRVEAKVEEEDPPRSGAAMSAVTDGRGRFALVGLRDAAYTVRASRASTQGLVFSPRTGVRAGEKELRLTGTEGLSITGLVAWSGKRPDWIAVTASAPTEVGPRHCDVGEDGAFRLDGLQPGTYQLEVRAAGLAAPVRRTVEAGQTGLRIDLP